MLADNATLRRYVEDKLQLSWSPAGQPAGCVLRWQDSPVRGA